ncbi:hypothetical protein OKA04_19215 [Luteolibacter flavescens]|uniref:Verru_Chthon cassette protein A n=1 Tax=Luteolibacter flavescens TaxID=1859460 RepID=A0ABT3FTG9_9BACT|nr:hypothetical protein [Luteolibacter flavescens]MCW1886878.1 hypothetical protein [Luteolibacter flavescens]
MVLVTILAVGLLSLTSIELRKSSIGDARAAARANARLGLMMALSQLQKDLGDDRRSTADASILASSANPAAVGVWNGWSPELVTKTTASSTPRVDYVTPKQQTGFRSWLVSQADPQKTRELLWHATAPAGDVAKLFTQDSSGFELFGEKVPVDNEKTPGSFAWAVSQENTRAKINIGADNKNRQELAEQLHAPARPNLSLTSYIKHPEDNWDRRPATIVDFLQASLDPGYGVDRADLGKARAHFTSSSYSLLTNPVKGGLKADFSTGFEMTETEFIKTAWQDGDVSIPNPFRGGGPTEYKGQKPLFTPVANNAQVQVTMDFPPASVKHKYQVNGVPTFDMLRNHYRSYRHLYGSSEKDLTAFERPYAHIATPSSEIVSGRPFGTKTQPSIQPVLDRMNLFFSVMAKNDGTLCLLLTPLVTVWNPYNVSIESEGMVIYPWIDFAVYWPWQVKRADTGANESRGFHLSRFVGEGYQSADGQYHGRSSRPYFYFHLTETGSPVGSGTSTIGQKIKFAPGEVKVFCLADATRRDLQPNTAAASRTWRMRTVTSASDITASLKGGVILNMRNSINHAEDFNYLLKNGDQVMSQTATFDRDQYPMIVNMADSYQIKNPSRELMVEARPANGAQQALPAERNLYFYTQVQSTKSYAAGKNSMSYPTFAFNDIKENPRLVGSLLTYHRVAQSLPGVANADLMFTTNPRQAFVNHYLSGTQMQSGPHYETMMQGGTSLAALAVQTTPTGAQAYYGPSHSSSTGYSHLPFFEIPQSPMLSLGALQHCDLSATAFGNPSQVGNSWASPYLPGSSVARRMTMTSGSDPVAITPTGLGVYDMAYLANEALFDGFFFSGATPGKGQRKASSSVGPNIWNEDLMSSSESLEDVLGAFYNDPAAKPLRNPRMAPHYGGKTADQLKVSLSAPAGSARIAGHLMVDGGFNINSTSEDAWAAMLSSLRGAEPVDKEQTPQSRFRHIVDSGPAKMVTNDPWAGFRALTDADIKTLATNIVAEVKLRGPFLSLGEFVNRRIATDRTMNISGAVQSAIDKTDLNKKVTYPRFDTAAYPNRENLPNPNTGTNTPGWLSQADVLGALAPFITSRSDTFVIRSQGEARDEKGNILAQVCLEAVVQRVPEYVDPKDDASTLVANLQSDVNKSFGRRFEIISVRELARVQSASGTDPHYN